MTLRHLLYQSNTSSPREVDMYIVFRFGRPVEEGKSPIYIDIDISNVIISHATNQSFYFVEYVGNEIKDAWLDSVEVDTKLAQKGFTVTHDEDIDDVLPSEEIGKIRRRIAAYGRCHELMENGDFNVYEETKEVFEPDGDDSLDMFAEDDESAAASENPGGGNLVCGSNRDRIGQPSESGGWQSDYVYDEASGYYYSSSSGNYYDPSSGLHCCGTSGQWYSYSKATGSYDERLCVDS
ncbi:hypothetical protein Vadar_022157 [Vaccinium darrowii]|uniref:Uncharacterized protein n=1 Tax=Vaccinium darrowii TaxID=229202 RepID=A0ACB7Y0V6_9ERIC|nr:hypothetical protein Vadar_022157 [Vaccinium darrowii]